MNDAELQAWLTGLARRLNLNADNVDEAPEEALRELAREIMGELAARGLVAQTPLPGCYARRREPGN